MHFPVNSLTLYKCQRGVYTPHDSCHLLVAPHSGKIIKNSLQCFWKRRKFSTKGILHRTNRHISCCKVTT